MPPYPPIDPTDPTEPLDSRPAKYGAEELRALKQRITDLEESIAISSGVCGGRLTLTESEPVIQGDVSGENEMFFVPYVNNVIALYNGTGFIPHVITSLTNVSTNDTFNPAAVAPNSMYDFFVWDDDGTLRLGRGPAWASPTSRGTGAGTTDLERVLGTLVNAEDIVNGPLAQRGTYVGSAESDAAGLWNFDFGGNAVGGAEIKFLVWNYYNQVLFSCDSRDTGNWTYADSIIRPLNDSLLNRIRFVRGQKGHHLFATLSVFVTGNPGADDAAATIGFGLDSIVAFNGNSINASFQKNGQAGGILSTQLLAVYAGTPSVGVHFLQALEYAEGSAGAAQFSGNGALLPHANIGIHAQWAG